MTRKRSRPRGGARKRPSAAAVLTDSRRVTPLDSEDEAGTYAPPGSEADTGESDDGVLAQGPPPSLPSRMSRAKRRKEALR